MDHQVRVRPLHRFLTIDPCNPITKDGANAYAPLYGDHSYLTADYNFCIRLRLIQLYGGQWYIDRHLANNTVDEIVSGTGIYEVGFPRRRDAVEALEHILEGIE